MFSQGCRIGYSKTVAHLLQKSLNISVISGICEASGNGYLDVVMLPLSHDADVHADDGGASVQTVGMAICKSCQGREITSFHCNFHKDNYE